MAAGLAFLSPAGSGGRLRLPGGRLGAARGNARALCLLQAFAAGVLVVASPAAEPELPELKQPAFRFSEARGLGFEQGVCRRDPSDVIQVEQTYYLWYTRVDERSNPALFPSGYAGEVWFATSRDGRVWQEQGKALGTGPAGAFDAHGVFTPNVLASDGKYYLFYTAVQPTPGRDDGVFENNATSDRTAIGLAVSDSPMGPFVRASTSPVLETSESANRFDSYRVDDACLIVRDGKYWLYYKGRSRADGRNGPRRTKMGVAIAERPDGPYVKYGANPVLDSGHEVLVWPHRVGVAALVSDTGPQARTVQHALDGVGFRKVGELPEAFPRAPGAFRPDAFDNTKFGRGFLWGISMGAGPHPYLVRYDVNLAVPESGPSP